MYDRDKHYKAKIVADLELLECLIDGNLQVPKVVSVSGKEVNTVGNYNTIVYNFIPGSHITRFSNDQLRQVGRFLGKFHTIGSKCDWRQQKEKFYNLPPLRIKKIVKLSKGANIEPKKIDLLLKLTKELNKFAIPKDLQEGPIHVDVKPDNVLFNKAKISGVIDFDNAYIGPFILDLAKAMVWFGRSGGNFKHERLRSLYKGYVEARTMTSREYEYLYNAVNFAFLSHIIVDYYMYAIGKTSSKYFSFITGEFFDSYKSFKLKKEQFYKLID